MSYKNAASAAPTLLKITSLHPFEGHPYKVQDNAEMDALVESIRANGILAPLVVRPIADTDEYEVISGHRRLYAAQKAGLSELPVLIRVLDRDSAAIAVVDSNLHREHILPSEKAFAYKLKMEALSHQGITCGQVGHKSRDDISDADSGRQVQRYIRLTHLIPEFLEKMDKGEIALSVGVELSYLDDSSQREVLEQCAINDCTPSYSQAWRMHKAGREGLLTKDVIQFLMSEEKANQRETVKVPASRLREVLPKGLDAGKTEDFIIKACEYYRKYLIRQRSWDER